MAEKRVFISYSHDSDDHRQWVMELAEFLVENGVDVLLDQWDLDFGDDLPSFMEQGITETDRVLVICTDLYIAKANAGTGGVGYEKTIVTAEILGNRENRRKFIPVVRNIAGDAKVPTFFGAAYYADLSDEADQKAVRDELIRTIHEVPVTKPSLGASPFIPKDPPVEGKGAAGAEEELPSIDGGDTCVGFGNRFSQAFPGLRGVEWFEDRDVIQQRLEILLSEPLEFKQGQLVAWWRGPTNLSIRCFEHIEGSHYLMDVDEINIRRIAAVSQGAYYRKFVYVETTPDSPTGLYEWGDERIRDSVELLGYASEEFGLVDGTLPVSRAEYDDGAAIIKGAPVDISGRVELRARYLTPYNFIIAPHCTPLNTVGFDDELQTHLNALAEGGGSFEDMCDAIGRLPKRH